MQLLFVSVCISHGTSTAMKLLCYLTSTACTKLFSLYCRPDVSLCWEWNPAFLQLFPHMKSPTASVKASSLLSTCWQKDETHTDRLRVWRVLWLKPEDFGVVWPHCTLLVKLLVFSPPQCHLSPLSSSPTAQYLPSELFDKWPHLSVHGTITMFTFCSVQRKVLRKNVVIPDGQKTKEAILYNTKNQSWSTMALLKWQQDRRTHSQLPCAKTIAQPEKSRPLCSLKTNMMSN